MNQKQKGALLVKVLKEKYVREDFHTEGLFKILIGTILSQRTRDENMFRALDNLFSVAKTPKEILDLPPQKLRSLIKCSGPYKQKAIKIRKTCQALVENFNGQVPKTREELLSLYGVGYKTADIVLSYGYGKPTIAVDTHVEKVAKRLGFAGESAKYEEIRLALEESVPEKDRLVINMGIVQFGRQVCRRTNPKCAICPLSKACHYYGNLKKK